MASINGTPKNDVLLGTQFNDSIFGLAGADTLVGENGNDSLNGGDGSDSILGEDGNDTLNGGTGNNILIGGSGNDTYIVDSIVDSITETTNGGTDTVRSTVSWTLGAYLNKLILTGTAGSNGTGNNLNNIITGNAANNSLFGGNGNDTLNGGGGNDTLDGGTGNNILIGGSGNDTYIVNSIADSITETVNGGTDTVRSTVSWTLGAYLNKLILTGTGASNGTGNNLNNIITGNTANNSLFGGNGNDTLNGRGGNDFFDGGNGSDILNGGDGNDTFLGVIGNDTLNGGGGNDFFDGGNGNDILNGAAGNDILSGGVGNDILTGSISSAVGEIDILAGGEGIDRFVLGDSAYDDGNSATAGISDYALITDFSTSNDLLQLNRTSNNYFVATSPSGLPAGTAIFIDKPDEEPNELIAIVQGLAEFNLSNLNGRNGFVVNGKEEADFSGESVSAAGDVNGDGFSDLLIGAGYADHDDQYSPGESYVVFGQAEGFDVSLNLSNLNGGNGFELRGTKEGDLLGNSVSAAGDVNGDGFSDLLVGARGAAPKDQDAAGSSYVIFGQEGGFNNRINVDELDGSNGFAINGIDADDESGNSVSAAGDINGDGFSDLLIGARFATPNGQSRAGESYVVFGQAGGFGASLNLSDLDGSNGFVLNGINANDFSGNSVSTAGDVNGDGFDDLLIGTYRASTNGQENAGSSYVVFGQAGGFGASLNLSDLDGSNGFVLNGIDANDLSGISVSAAGDVNGDGLDDLLIGASEADSNGQSRAGESYVVFGQAAGFGASLNLSDLDGSNGFVLNGIDANDELGISVSAGGDVNGDGFDDLLLGAHRADPNGGDTDPNGPVRAGESYVVFGNDFTFAVTHPGTSGDDSLTGTASKDILIGGLGDDVLVGGFDNDVLIGGSGDDILSFDAADRRINGGSDTDTLRIDGSGVNLNLTTISNNKLTGFELIDLTGTGNNSLTFNQLDMLDLSDTTNQLLINGNAGDRVASTGLGWTSSGTTTEDDILYNRYILGAATLLVDVDITSTIT